MRIILGSLYEELLADSELTRPTHHPKLRIARAEPATDGWLDVLLSWLRQRRAGVDRRRLWPLS